MKFTKKIYSKENVEVRTGCFSPAEGSEERHLIFTSHDTLQSFLSQYEHINDIYLQLSGKGDEENCVVFKRYFVSDAANQAPIIEEKEAAHSYPVSIVQQPPLNGSKVALWVYMRKNITHTGNNDSLSCYEHNGYRHYWTASLHSAGGNSEQQTRKIFESYCSLLEHHKCSLEQHCIRTWLFVQNVDVNYGGVVKARKELFSEHGLTEKTHYIASTGIEGRHCDPDVFVQMDAYAIEGLQEGQQQYLYAREYLNPTYEYGVTFERGTAIEYGDRKHIYLSGTASINNKGEVVHPGNILLQTKRMLTNVAQLLAEAGASCEDIAQAVVYLRDPADYATVSHYFAQEFPDMPYVIVLAPVCRPGWLIEMECIAIKENRNEGFRNF